LKSKRSSFELMKKYAVQADSVEEFCDRFHRKGAYHDRGKEYMDYDLQSHLAEFKRDGYTIIPKGSTVTGETVAFYGQNYLPKD